MSSDLDVLKDIPGYKAILKSVLKSQIQLLIEQLSQHTGEETIILTACVNDGSLSHLGSMTGKGFLEGREEIKSQFLGYCLKTVNKRTVPGIRASPYQRPSLGNTFTQKCQKVQSVVLHKPGSDRSSLGSAITSTEVPVSQDIGNDNSALNVNITNGSSMNLSVVKYEDNEQTRYNFGSSNSSKVNDSFPSGLHLSHTQTSITEYSEANQSDNHKENDSTGKESETDDSNAASIKIEPITENEMDLEITGVEPGNGIHTEAWAHRHGSHHTDQSDYRYEVYKSTSYEGQNDYQYHNDRDFYLDAAVSSLTPCFRKHSCEICGRMFTMKKDMKRHIKIHTGEKEFTCEDCGYSCYRKDMLKIHRKRRHMSNVLTLANLEFST